MNKRALKSLIDSHIFDIENDKKKYLVGILDGVVCWFFEYSYYLLGVKTDELIKRIECSNKGKKYTGSRSTNYNILNLLLFCALETGKEPDINIKMIDTEKTLSTASEVEAFIESGEDKVTDIVFETSKKRSFQRKYYTPGEISLTKLTSKKGRR